MSNIAWLRSEDRAVERVLAEAGVDALEVAPARMFDDPFQVADDDALRAARDVRSRGFELVAFQSLLFGAAGLTLFGSDDDRALLADRFTRIIRLAGAMSVPVLVYGAPSTRRVPDGMTDSEASEIAAHFFSVLAPRAEDSGTTLCIEPNPPVYGCNFVTDSDEGARLVRAVDAPGFGLHLDAAGMTLAGEDIAHAIQCHSSLLRHFHASAPDLGPLEDTVVDHDAAGRALRQSGYDGVVSVEMRSGPHGTNAARVRAAVELALDTYRLRSIGVSR